MWEDSDVSDSFREHMVVLEDMYRDQLKLANQFDALTVSLVERRRTDPR
jgi:hypothetical protein